MAAPLNTNLDFFQCIPAASFNTSGLTGTFQPLNGTGFPVAIKMLKVYNGSGVDIDISYDGVTKNDFWPSGATIIFDFQTNHNDNPPYGSGQLQGREGQIVYGRTSSTSGQLQIAGYL